MLNVSPASSWISFFSALQFLLHVAGHFGQKFQVERHAVLLHLHEHAYQGDLDVAEKGLDPDLRQLRLEKRPQPQGDLRVLARVFRDLFQLHFGHRNLLRAGSDQRLGRNFPQVQVFERQRVDAERPGGRIDQVRRDHGVEIDALNVDAVPPQNQHVVLDVLPAFPDAGVFENGLELPQGRPRPARLSERKTGPR